MAQSEIPLSNGVANAHQIQYVQLNGLFVEMRINWRTYTEQWVLDAYVEGELILAGITLKPDAEITAPYSNIDIRVFFVGKEPTLDNLGVDNHLVYYV